MKQAPGPALTGLGDAGAPSRPIEPAGMLECDSWRLKMYTITYRGSTELALVEASKEVTEELLGEVPDDVRPHGEGFLVVHDGRDGNMIVLGLWANENELILNTWTSPNDSPGELERVSGLHPRACVWDLHVVAFEARAWLELTLRGNGPDGDQGGYLNAWFDGVV